MHQMKSVQFLRPSPPTCCCVSAQSTSYCCNKIPKTRSFVRHLFWSIILKAWKSKSMVLGKGHVLLHLSWEAAGRHVWEKGDLGAASVYNCPVSCLSLGHVRVWGWAFSPHPAYSLYSVHLRVYSLASGKPLSFYLDLAKGSLHAITGRWLRRHSEVEDVTGEGLMAREKSQNCVNGLENFISLLEVQYLFSKANSKSGWIKVFNLSKLSKSLSWNLEIPAWLIEQLKYK